MGSLIEAEAHPSHEGTDIYVSLACFVCSHAVGGGSAPQSDYFDSVGVNFENKLAEVTGGSNQVGIEVRNQLIKGSTLAVGHRISLKRHTGTSVVHKETPGTHVGARSQMLRMITAGWPAAV